MRELTEEEIFPENYIQPADAFFDNKGGISVEDIQNLKDNLYPGQVIRVKKPRASGTSFVDCSARVVDKYKNIVTLEDINNPGRIFTMPYKSLVGRSFTDG